LFSHPQFPKSFFDDLLSKAIFAILKVQRSSTPEMTWLSKVKQMEADSKRWTKSLRVA
jgi:hypothetical protein